MRPKDAVIGIGAALRSPGWTGGSRLQVLMQEPAASSDERSDPHVAIRASAVTLRVLGRLPFSPWRNTCLYRSVAECLILRHLGLGGVLRLGVTHADDCAATIAAHAWVERGTTDQSAAKFVALRPSR